MATNLYFSQKVKSEQDLYENIVIESLKMYGQDVYFLPRSIVAKDTVFSEDVVSRFDDAHLIEVYLENIDGYAGDGDLFTRFGVEIRDQANFVLSKRRWDEVMQDAATSQKRPYEGDLVYIPLSNSIFEITKVEDERPFYQLSNLPTYRLTCELFEYSGEQFQTGISADIIEVDFAYQYILTINDSATNNQGQSININSIAESDGMIAIVGEQDSAFGGFSKIEQTLANNVTITGEIIDNLLKEDAPVLSCAGGLMIEHPLTREHIDRIDGTEDSVMGLSKDLVTRLLGELRQKLTENAK